MRQLGLLVLLLLAVPGTASAATWTVNSLANGNDTSCDPLPAGCTLRDALFEASDGDTINFDFSLAVTPSLVISPTFASISVFNSDLLIDGFDCTGCGAVSQNTADPADGLNHQVAIAIDGSNMFFNDEPVHIFGDRVVFRGFNVRGAPASGIYVDADEV